MAERLSPNDWAVLALVSERSSHGWALAAKLARGGEIGTIWAISRPVVYHGLDRLEREGMIRAAGLERGGRGPHRVVYAVTDAGRAELGDWLRAPVQHVRDIRSLFLLKVVLSERAGVDVEPLLIAQRAALVPLVAWLEAQLDDAGTEAPGETTVAVFRLETAGAVVRFIDGMLDRSGAKSMDRFA
ncbi:MAG TPA: PadR family transcriptional regulator [Gaiellaceae bacterium]|jgi:PadR family transcriptional regulator AphA|nr:PadR family transcriptional regulator [Gaiellaceae bacterium]